jgi:hypothetical protein
MPTPRPPHVCVCAARVRACARAWLAAPSSASFCASAADAASRSAESRATCDRRHIGRGWHRRRVAPLCGSATRRRCNGLLCVCAYVCARVCACARACGRAGGRGGDATAHLGVGVAGRIAALQTDTAHGTLARTRTAQRRGLLQHGGTLEHIATRYDAYQRKRQQAALPTLSHAVSVCVCVCACASISLCECDCAWVCACTRVCVWVRVLVPACRRRRARAARA